MPVIQHWEVRYRKVPGACKPDMAARILDRLLNSRFSEKNKNKNKSHIRE